MAVKAVFWIKDFEPESDGTYKVRMNIFAASNNAANVQNDEFFSPTATSATVNASLHTFVQGYIEDQWSITGSYPIIDQVKLLNPVSLL